MMTVQERIWVNSTGIYSGNGIGQGKQVFILCALIGAENAFIFPAKEVPKLSSSKLEERTIRGVSPASLTTHSGVLQSPEETVPLKIRRTMIG